MKEWKKPVVTTLSEEELKNYILASACSNRTCEYTKSDSLGPIFII